MTAEIAWYISMCGICLGIIGALLTSAKPLVSWIHAHF